MCAELIYDIADVQNAAFLQKQPEQTVP